MTKDETRKLMRFLRAVYANPELFHDDGDVFAAWYIVLKDYSYDEVKTAALKTVRYLKSGVVNAKDVLRTLTTEQESQKEQSMNDGHLHGAFLMLSLWPRFRELYHAAGLQTWEEARNDGQAFETWLQKRNETEPFPALAKANTEAEARKLENEWAQSNGIALPDIDCFDCDEYHSAERREKADGTDGK